MGAACSSSYGHRLDGEEEEAPAAAKPVSPAEQPAKRSKKKDGSSRAGASSSQAVGAAEEPLRGQGWKSWLLYRAGTPINLAVISLLIMLNASRFEVWEGAYADAPAINPASVQVVWNLTSLLIALVVSFSLDGTAAIDKILCWQSLWRFLCIALLFTLASHMIILAFRLGVPRTLVATVGYLYLPIAALLSIFAFPRRYGVLEWLALAIMTLSTISFILLRERSKWLAHSEAVQVGTHVMTNAQIQMEEDFDTFFDFLQIEGVGFVFGAVTISALASVLAELLYKNSSFSEQEPEHGLAQLPQHVDNFYIMKVHIDLASLLFSLCIWAMPDAITDRVAVLSTSETWFGPWTWRQGLMVLIAVIQGWLAGLACKMFSTVCKAVAQTLSTIVAVCVFDPLLNMYDWRGRALPTLALAAIVIGSAIFFQTGRINGRIIRRRQRKASRGMLSAENGAEAASRSQAGGSVAQSAKGQLIDTRTRQGDAAAKKADDEAQGGKRQEMLGYLLMFSYVLVFAVESLVKQYALSRTPIVSGSMNLMTFVFGASLASLKTLHVNGVEGLKHAWSWWQIVKFLPCGVLFACSQALVFAAYAMHVPASIVTILGFVYTPISAFGKRCVLRKVTMWLQWVALMITTFASMTFGFLQNVSPSKGTDPVGLVGLLCVIGSATLSAFASLVMEKFLKDETDPFHVQKVALDVGSILTSVLLLPLSGIMSERQQDAFWRDRPLEGCTDQDCWGPVGSNQTCAAKACECTCGSGLFIAWDSVWVWLALVIITCKSWFKGEVTKRTSTLEVAIVESFGPLLIYFVGEPIMFSKQLTDWALNAVVFIAPLSAVVFNVAELEQVKVIEGMKAAGLRSVASEEEGGGFCPLEAFLENMREVESEESTEEYEDEPEAPASQASASAALLCASAAARCNAPCNAPSPDCMPSSARSKLFTRSGLF